MPSSGTSQLVLDATGTAASWALFDDGASVTTGATVTGLTPGSTYEFRVAAVNLEGQGDWAEASAVVGDGSYTPHPSRTYSIGGEERVLRVHSVDRALRIAPSDRRFVWH